MNKCIILILSLLFFTFGFTLRAYAATPTPTSTERIKLPIDEQINELKSRIASRVAELKLVERRGVIGTVTEVTDTQITLNDITNATRFVDVDELTKFSSPSAKGNFGISDITKGSKVGVLGLYNKQSRRLLARFVDVLFLPKTASGTIYGLDTENYSFKVAMEGGKTTTIDVETITRTSSYTKGEGVTKSGFSKLQDGMRVYVVGVADIKDSTHIIASRIIIFPNLPPNPKITVPNMNPALNPQETIVPSTGSGKKLTPIAR